MIIQTPCVESVSFLCDNCGERNKEGAARVFSVREDAGAFDLCLDCVLRMAGEVATFRVGQMSPMIPASAPEFEIVGQT